MFVASGVAHYNSFGRGAHTPLAQHLKRSVHSKGTEKSKELTSNMYVCVCMYEYMYIHIYIYINIYLSFNQSIKLSFFLSFYLSIYMYMYIYTYIQRERERERVRESHQHA